MIENGVPVSFENLLSRADDVVLQELIGPDVVRLLRSIDPNLATPTKLRNLLSEFKEPAELLRDTNSRTVLLELLSVVTAEQLRGTLNLSSGGNPFDALKNLNVQRGSLQEKRLFSFFGQDIPEEGNRGRIPESLWAQGKYPLFDHQRRAVLRVQQILASGRRRVLLHMPTGSGKTRTAMNVIAEHLRRNEPSLVVWLAFSDELCEQAIEEFEQAWEYLGNRPINVYRYWGASELDLQTAYDGFVVAGLGKMYNYAMGNLALIATLADRTSLVVIDEAHQSIAPTYQLVLETLVEKQPTTGLLGLSATPGRTWNNVDEDQRLADFFRRQKVSLEVQGFANPVEYLVEQGYLARPIFSPLFYNSGADLSPKDLADIESGLDIPARILDRLAQDEQRNLGIIHRAEQIAQEHRRTILFAASVGHAKLLAAVLRARGIAADSITGDTPSGERRRVINRYRGSFEGPIVLCNYGVLTAGFDAPNTSAAIVARPTKSLVLYSQMVGRALRGPLAGGNQEAQVITVVDTNLPGFGDLGESFFNWEDVWT